MLEILYSREKENLDRELLERIGRDVKTGKKVTLLVPEQQVHSAETMLSYNNIMSPELEVVGFRRLCESIFRRFGGLAYNNITDGARLILMWRTIAELSPMLKEYGNIALDDLDMIKSLLASVSELSLYGISPKTLEDAAKKLKEKNGKLSRKLEDLSLIAAANSALLKTSFNDPAEDTKRAVGTLENNDYFGGRTVYIAHFISFTVYEKQIISNIIKNADDIFAFVGMDKGDGRDIFDTLKKTRDVFLKSAADSGVKTTLTQLENRVSRPKEIDYFSENIWNFSAQKYTGPCDAIRLVEAQSAREEAKFVAADIAKKVRALGARYRDFAIVLRNAADYEGIIDSALADFGIPSFISSKSDIKVKASIKMILLSLKIRSHRWQTEDVISYIRCGFTDLPEDICDKLEQYATLWKISGRRWFDEYEWSMHPRGFGAEMKDSDRAVLDELNHYRKVLVSPLVKLFETFEKGPTLREASVALYKYLEAISLRRKLEMRSAELRDRGNVAEADETVQIWNCLMESLDSLVTVAGDMRCDSSSYSKLLSASLEMSSIGKIPSGIDEVVIGEAPGLRVSGAKYVYVIGLCEGVFPAAAREDAVLGDRDRRILLGEGIELSGESFEGARDEMFYFYLAGSAAKEELTFTYNKEKNTSTFVYSLRSIFEGLKTVSVSDMDRSELVWSDMSALEYLVMTRDNDSENSDKIRKYLEKRGNIGFFRDTDLLKEKYRYTGEKQLFGDYIGLSQTRLESYALCPFAYFCKYILSVTEEPSSEASYADIGTFVHAFLEKFIPKLFENGTVLSGDGLNRAFSDVISECERSLGESAKDPAVKNLVERLKNTLSLATENLVSEFANSDFRPRFYELEIGNGSPKPMTIELPDGGKVGVYGKIDRVDTYEQDGKVYVKIVDYKTGEKIFDRSELEYGINMQMLLYLASVCRSQDKEFLEKLGVNSSEDIVPAGVIYLSTKMPDAVNVNELELDEKKITDDAAAKLKRAGLVCDDEKILFALDNTRSGKYIPVAFKKDGGITASSQKSLVSSFDEIIDGVNATVARIAGDMKAGKADATPLKIKDHDACAYCEMAPVCRRKSYCAEKSEMISDDDDTQI